MEYHTNYTGGPRVLVNLLEGIDLQKISPVIISNVSSQMTDDITKLGLKTYVLPFTKRLGLKNEKLLKEGFLQRINTLKELINYNRCINKIIREHNINCIWARNVKGVLLTGIFTILNRKVLIWDIGMEKPSRGFVFFLHLIGFILSYRVVVEAYSVVNQVFHPLLIRIFGHKIIKISSAIPESRAHILNQLPLKPFESSKPFNILFIGTMNERKKTLY